jgi:hypothetical protein
MKMYKKFGEKLAVKRPFGRHKHRWEGNIIDIKEMQCDNMGWLWDQWRTLVEIVTKIRVPEMMENLLTC